MKNAKFFLTLSLVAAMFAFLACSGADSSKADSQVAAKAQVASNTPTKVVSLDVSGMTCTGCEASVKMALRKIDGVKDVKASYKEGAATVTINPEKVKEEQLIQALDNIGYPAKKKSES
ncbi:MAG: copper chaperone [Calditrichaeota bacterium]|nr:MAG: copper chaperone [Calditrichota bacterium]